jgi:hypothetical protein
MVALTFPLDYQTFVDILHIQFVHWTLEEFVEKSGAASRDIMAKWIAEPKWSAEVTMAPMEKHDARIARALMRRIGLTNKFQLYNPDRPYPANDPDGTNLGASVITVSSLPGTREIRMTGFPPNYRLTWGDFIQIVYGASPAKSSFHEILGTDLSDSSGVIGALEINPPPHSLIQVGDTVRIKKPWCKMQFISYDPGVSDIILMNGMTFKCIEVM